MSCDSLADARELVASRLGLDFSPRVGAGSQRRLEAALRRAAGEHDSLALSRLAAEAPESPVLMGIARHLTVGETYFFRDEGFFHALEHHVLPKLIAARRAAGMRQLRIWSAGCSTGEEPYSVAILLDRLLPDFADWRVSLVATDINPDSLKRAREARYRDWSFRSTPTGIRERYFHRIDENTYELASHIRERVSFRPLNLAENTYPSANSSTTALDLILCRNVLMYFTEAARQATITRLQQALVPGGWLAVAAPEASSAVLAPLTPVNFTGTTLFQKRVAAPGPVQPEIAPVAASRPRRRAAPPLGPSTPAAPRSPRSVESLTQQARELANRGAIKEARTLCEIAARREPLNIEPLLLIATISDGGGDVDTAQKALRRVLFLEPDCILAQYTLGTLLLRQKDRSRGMRLVERSARLLEQLPNEALIEHGDGVTVGELLGRALRWLKSS